MQFFSCIDEEPSLCLALHSKKRGTDNYATRGHPFLTVPQDHFLESRVIAIML